MSQVIAFAVDPGRKPYTRTRSDLDHTYRAWLRTQPCAVKGCKSRFQEAAHTGDRGLGTKADDHRALPLCLFHHRSGKQSYHKLGRRGFEKFHQLDIEKLIQELNDWYAVERRTR